MARRARAGAIAAAKPILEGLRQEVTDVDDFGRMSLDHGIAEHARTVAADFDLELVLDDVDDLVDHKPHGAALIGEHQDRLRAFFLQAGFVVDPQQRHQLLAILHKAAPVGDFDAAAIDFLEPRHQRQRHCFRPLRSGTEHEQRHGILVRCGLVFDARIPASACDLRGTAERLGDAVRIEDHDDRAVAENGGAGEHRECGAASTTSA